MTKGTKVEKTRCGRSPEHTGKQEDMGAGFVREAILMENPMDRGAWQASVHAVTKS